MKKFSVIAMAIAMIFSVAAFAAEPAKPEAKAPSTEESKAKETCSKQGLQAAQLDECVKQEVEKSKQAAAPQKPAQ